MSTPIQLYQNARSRHKFKNRMDCGLKSPPAPTKILTLRLSVNMSASLLASHLTVASQRLGQFLLNVV